MRNNTTKTGALCAAWRIGRKAMAVLCMGVAGATAFAQTYPSRPITIIAPYPPGGAIEAATRSWMACAQEITGQPMVLLSRPGANGVVAANAFKQAPADGYTLMVYGMSQATITPFIFKKQPYDPEKEFHGAAMFGTAALMLVTSAQSGIKSLKDFQAYANARPNGIDIGNPGIASASHLLSAALAAKLDVKSTLVPFAGEAAGAVSLLAGDIPALVILAGSAAPYIESGKMVPIVSFSPQRQAKFPNVPTVVEELKDASLARAGWLGVTARAGTPQVAIDAVEGWTKACMANAPFRQALETALFTPSFSTQEGYAAVVRRDIDFWKPWITRLNISND